MSSDGSSLPPVTPDFVYIVKIGDYQHVLRPADLKSSNNLILARYAVANIDMARNLLTERGPFLVSEKQQKMDELICDAEEAINRVIKLLQPARVEQVSDESIRINTKTAWALQDEPRSSATFGRLQSTHDKLKTVLHDLEYIEATARLEDCEARASTIISRPTSSQSQQRQPSSPPAEPVLQPQNTDNLVAWKRSRRRQSRQTLSSESSSISGVASDDHPSAGLRSAVSSPGNTLAGLVGGSTRQLQDQASNIESLLRQTELSDDASDVSIGRLSVIHELDGASTITTVPERCTLDTISRIAGLTGSSRSPKMGGYVSTNVESSFDTQKGTRLTAVHSPVPMPSSSGCQQANSMSKPQPIKGMKRETFANYRERDKRERVSRQEPQAESLESTSSAPTRMSTSPQLESAAAPESALPRQSNVPAMATHQNKTPVVDKEQHFSATPLATNAAALAQGRESAQTVGELSQHNVAVVSKTEPPATRKQASQVTKLSTSLSSLKTVTGSAAAAAVKLPDAGAQKPQHLRNTISAESEAVPSSSQAHQPPQSSIPDTVNHDKELYQHRQSQPSAKTHEIFRIDPELTRLPSLLRAGHGARSKIPPPYPISETDSDLSGEDQVFELPKLRQVQSAIERPITAPPVPRPTARATHSPLQVIHPMDDHIHQRSFSDPVVPRINVTRAPTIPRKPLPYRNGASLSGPSPEFCRAEGNERVAVRPQSESIASVSVSQHGTSGPPSPLQSDNGQNLALPMPSSASIHSLSVLERSSLESSRRSSVSVEAQPQLQPSYGAVQRSPIPNPLAMHPTANSSPQAPAYQAQSAMIYPSQQEWTAWQPDYRSPAFQKSRHFIDPGHNMHLGPSEQPPPPPISRFRDSDQMGDVRHAPARSQTEPIEHHPLEQPPARARRASEQDQVPSINNIIHSGELLQPHQATNPLHDPPYLGRAQLVYIKQQPGPNYGAGSQPPSDQSSITRTAPPMGTEHNGKRLSVPDIGRGANFNHTAGRQSMNDRDLFGRQVWQADHHPRQSSDHRHQHQHQQLSGHSYYEPQHDFNDQQRRRRPRPPLEPQVQPRSQPLQSYDEPQRHGYQCDEQTQRHSQHQANKASLPPEEAKHVGVVPTQEGQVAPLVKASAEIPLYPTQSQHYSEPEPIGLKQVTKKKSSWLAHQANRSRLIKGRH